MTIHAEDKFASRELFAYATNNGDLYRSRTTAVIDNLARKVVKGQYRHEWATQAWLHVADDAAQRYTREHDAPGTHGSYGAFGKPVREDVAHKLANYYAEEVLRRAEAIIGPPEIHVRAHSFGHDGDGNPIAHYDVDGRRQTGKRRVQCGYSDYRMEGAPRAIEKAGFKPGWYELDTDSVHGNRTMPEGMTAVFRRKRIVVGDCILDADATPA